MLSGTPIYDIKPYLPVTDAHPEASGGFAEGTAQQEPLKVEIPDAILQQFPADRHKALTEILAEDPRPHYHADAARIYAFEFAGVHIRFSVDDSTRTLRVLE